MQKQKRDLTVELETTSGTISRFYVFVDGKRVIAEDGEDGGEWTGAVGEQTTIKVRVFGAGRAKYKLSLDLPGTANDQSLNFALTGGYHELQIDV